MSESDCLQLLQECNAEITALREKLAAAHTALQLPEDADLVENIKLLKLGAVRQYEKAMNNNARCQWEYRATVAAALAELRTQWNARYQDYVSKTDDSSWERRQELLTRMRELDATIAKLDLAICYTRVLAACKALGISTEDE